MDLLWAPWRLAYVTAAQKPAPADPCFICRAVAETHDRENHVVWRTPGSIVMLNKFPYNNGHLLVAPRAHKANLDDLASAELLEVMETVRTMVKVLGRSMNPEAYNVGLNLGRPAGAGLPGHLHWHIVPRWNGDTNFMTVLSDVRVLSQSLEAAFDVLREGLSRVLEEKPT